MNNSSEFKGLCPLCYMPVSIHDDSREITAGDKTENYHARCLHMWVSENTPAEATTQPIGLTLLEEYKKLVIANDNSMREAWIASNAPIWQHKGALLRAMRELQNIKLKTVSEKLGVSLSRLRRFEDGKPVRDARLLENAYYLYFDVLLSIQIAAENYLKIEILQEQLTQEECASE